MKVCLSNERKFVKFRDIEAGTVFKWVDDKENYVAMKLKVDGANYNAVNLADGEMLYFTPLDSVLIVHGQFEGTDV